MIFPVSTALTPVPSLTSATDSSQVDTKSAQGSGSFSEMLGKALDTVNNMEMDASHAAERMAAGLEPDIHSVMIASEKASLAFQLTAQVRNKILDAYQEVMRMQV